jgi:hypothetical protein
MANRVQFLICVFVLVASAALGTRTDGAVALADQPLAWIRTSADKMHFVYDGTDNPIVPWGFNYDHDEAGRLLEDYWADDRAKVANDFHEMKNLGANVVRVHLQLCRFMKSPEQPDEKNLARLGKLVRLAEETGVYPDVTGLGCYHKEEIPAWAGAKDSAGATVDPAVCDSLVGRYDYGKRSQRFHDRPLVRGSCIGNHLWHDRRDDSGTKCFGNGFSESRREVWNVIGQFMPLFY